MTPRALPHEVVNVILTLCEDLATPVSLKVAILIRYREFGQLASMQVNPQSYFDPERYYRDVIAVSFLKKYPEMNTGIDRKAAAISNFWASEKDCCRSNLRLAPFLDGCLDDPKDEAVFSFYAEVRKEVNDILGPCPDLLRGKFGPGATYGDRGRLTTVPDKMSSRPTLTGSAWPFLFQWGETAWARACAADSRPPFFVRGNRFTTVPKDSTKDRGICIEPSINVFYQLGYGQVIRERLKRHGLDLKSAQEVHRRVAREASLSGRLATIDLSNASDTVSINLVKLILPSNWFSVLSALRSPTTEIDGKTVRLEKFSSMGNGYTFELETLIFLAISKVAIRRAGLTANVHDNVYVYGDDIIVPVDAFDCVIAALRYSGFTPNTKKTFASGGFRESCGGDYFFGMDVRPYFQKVEPNEPQHFIAMANGLRRLACKDGLSFAHRPFLTRAWFRVLDALPGNVRRLRGPEALGDLVVHDSEERWVARWRHCIRYIKTYSPARFRKVPWQHFKPDVVLASALYGVGDGALGVTPRDSVVGYAERWVPFS